MSGVPYIRFFPDDWLAGTNELSPAEKGVLITIVALTASTGKPPANDPDRLARRFGCTRGTATKILAALINLGKVAEVDGALENGRAIKETKFSQKNSKKQSEKSKSRWEKEGEKPNENKGDADAAAKPRLSQPEPEPEPYINDVVERGRDVMAIRDVCIRAAGDSLKRDRAVTIAIRPITLLMDDPAHPCDFEADILPAIRDVAARLKPETVHSFNFFKDEIIRYRDARLAGNPKPQEPKHDRKHNPNAASRIGEIGAARRSVWREVVGNGEADGMAAPVREPARLCDSKTA